MKTKELRELSIEDLKQKELDLKRELFELRNQTQLGQAQSPARFGMIKKSIARVLTLIHEKEKVENGSAKKS